MGLLDHLKLRPPRAATAAASAAPAAAPATAARPVADLADRLGRLLPDIEAADANGAPGTRAFRQRARAVAESARTQPDLVAANRLLDTLEGDLADALRPAPSHGTAAESPPERTSAAAPPRAAPGTAEPPRPAPPAASSAPAQPTDPATAAASASPPPTRPARARRRPAGEGDGDGDGATAAAPPPAPEASQPAPPRGAGVAAPAAGRTPPPAASGAPAPGTRRAGSTRQAAAQTGLQAVASAVFSNGICVQTPFGFKVDIGKPTFEADRWRVDGVWEMTTEEAGGSAAKSRFRKWFGSEAQAQEFCADYRHWIGPGAFGLFAGVDSADAAGQMAVGDSTTRSGQRGVGGDREIDGGVVEVGMTFKISATHEVVVTRATATAVTMKVRVLAEAEGGVAVGAGVGDVSLAGMSASAAAGRSAGRVIEFSLPAGRAALDLALRTQRLPAGRSGAGWRETESSTGTTQRRSTEGHVLGVGIATENAVEDEQVRDESGTYRRVTAQGEGSARVTLPGNVVVGGDDRTRGAVTTGFTSDARHGSTLTVGVDGSSAADARETLAGAAGVGRGTDAPAGRDSGQWTLSMQFSDSDLTAFVRKVTSGRFDRSALGTAGAAGVALMRALRASSDLDSARLAVGEFVSSTGSRGALMIRQVIGGAIETDVALEGSQVYEGEAGRARVLAQIEALERRLGDGGDLPGVAAEIEAAYRQQAERLRAMKSPGRESDLAPALRARQIALNEPLMARLTALRRQVRAAVARAAAQAAPDRASAVRQAAGTSGHADSSVADHAAERAVVQGSQQALGALAADERRMYAQREAMNRLRTIVHAEHLVHSGATANPHSVNGRSPMDSLPTPFNDVGALYQEALQQERAGQAAVDLARQTIEAFEAQRPRVPANGVLDATAAGLVQELRQLAWRGHDELERARTAFAAAHDAYRRVRATVPRDQMRASFGSTQLPAA